MIPPEFDYVAPDTLDEALQALSEGGEDAKALAGGHSLLPLMKLRLAAPTLLVDLRKVPGLRGVQRENGQWRIGAMTRHADMQGNADLGPVGQATALIADQQVRNRGTIGGSLVHGDPASDLPTVFLACEGSLTVVGSGGTREVAAADMFEDYLTTAVGEGEIVTEIRVPTFDELGLELPEVHPPRRGLGHGRGPGDGQEGRRRLRRGRPHRPDQHGLDAAAGDRRGGRPARQGRSTPSRRPPSRRPRARIRRAT